MLSEFYMIMNRLINDALSARNNNRKFDFLEFFSWVFSVKFSLYRFLLGI